MIGKEIGNYRILKELGKGGMGVVYKAHQLSLGRSVAMKVLPGHLTNDSSFIKRFHNEARAIAKLNHPNIVQIFDIGHEDDVHYYTMEFIEGPTLDDVVYKEGFLSPDRTLAIIGQVSKALRYAHSQGIVHRDIKPSNIMIAKSGRVKVTDFGLALQERTTRLTVDGGIVGTPEYMSPEQATGRTATAQSDIYSLGVVAYELLTGKVPFEGESPLLILNKIQNSEPPWPRSVNPDIPVDLENVVRRMMARDKDDRYKSCQEIIQDTQRIKSGQSVSLQLERSPALRRAGEVFAVLAILAVVVIGAAFAFKALTAGDGGASDAPPKEFPPGTAPGNRVIIASPETTGVETVNVGPAIHAPPSTNTLEELGSSAGREEAWAVPNLDSPSDIAQALAELGEKLKAVRLQHSWGERAIAESDFEIIERRLKLVKERMGDFQDAMYPDKLVLKTGKEMKGKITAEWLQRVRFDMPRPRRQIISREMISDTLYATNEESRIAGELLRIREKIDGLSREVSTVKRTLYQHPEQDAAESPPDDDFDGTDERADGMIDVNGQMPTEEESADEADYFAD